MKRVLLTKWVQREKHTQIMNELESKLSTSQWDLTKCQDVVKTSLKDKKNMKHKNYSSGIKGSGSHCLWEEAKEAP